MALYFYLDRQVKSITTGIKRNQSFEKQTIALHYITVIIVIDLLPFLLSHNCLCISVLLLSMTNQSYYRTRGVKKSQMNIIQLFNIQSGP